MYQVVSTDKCMQDTITPFHLPVIMTPYPDCDPPSTHISALLALRLFFIFAPRRALSALQPTSSPSLFLGAPPAGAPRLLLRDLGVGTNRMMGLPSWQCGFLPSFSRNSLEARLALHLAMPADHSACNLAQSTGTTGLRTGRDPPPST